MFKVICHNRLVRRLFSVFLTILWRFLPTAKFACGYILRGIASIPLPPYTFGGLRFALPSP